jgi:hypothetical protein
MSYMMREVALLLALAGLHAEAFIFPEAFISLAPSGPAQPRQATASAHSAPAARKGRGVAPLAPMCAAAGEDATDASGRTVIIGGGPTGLCTAMMLAQKGWSDVHVYDRLPPPPSPDDETVWGDTARFYLIGLGGRGQKALKELGAWDEVDRYCNTVCGRMDWAPGAGPDDGVERIFTDRPYLTKVIASDPP